MNDEAFRCRPEIIKWIAGHERQLWISGPMRYLNVIRIDDFCIIHSILKNSTQRCERDDVVWTNVSDWSKERQSDKFVLVHGGAEFAHSLSRLVLIDE
jgi:hypothetical protein